MNQKITQTKHAKKNVRVRIRKLVKGGKRKTTSKNKLDANVILNKTFGIINSKRAKQWLAHIEKGRSLWK